MYYLYGIGAFNEVAFVAMLKSGIDTGVYGAVAAFGASFLFARIIEGSLVGILDIGGAIQTGIGLGVPALLLGAGFVFPVANFAASLVTGLVLGRWRWAASSFWRVSSPSTRAIPPTAPT